MTRERRGSDGCGESDVVAETSGEAASFDRCESWLESRIDEINI